MTKEEIEDIVNDMKTFAKYKKVDGEFIDNLKKKLTKDGSINIDECSELVHNSPLKLKIRTIRELDGDHWAYGIGYKNIVVEFYQESEAGPIF